MRRAHSPALVTPDPWCSSTMHPVTIATTSTLVAAAREKKQTDTVPRKIGSSSLRKTKEGHRNMSERRIIYSIFIAEKVPYGSTRWRDSASPHMLLLVFLRRTCRTVSMFYCPSASWTRIGDDKTGGAFLKGRNELARANSDPSTPQDFRKRLPATLSDKSI